MLACGAGTVLIAMKDGLFQDHCSYHFNVGAVPPSYSFPISTLARLQADRGA
jgi:hypothetical protein